MIGPEFFYEHRAESHLILARSDEILRNRSLVVESFELQRRQRKVRHPQSVAIDRYREKPPLGFHSNQPAHRDETPSRFPAVELVKEHCRPDSLLTVGLLPDLGRTDVLPPTNLHLHYIPTTASVQLPEKINAEEGGIESEDVSDGPVATV